MTTSSGGSTSASPDLENLAKRIQRLEDIEAIKYLLVRYAQGSDHKNDPDVMVPLFTEYGTFDGHKAIREFLEGAPGIIDWSLHYMISPLIQVAEDGQTADVFCYLWEIANMPDGKGGLEPVFIGGTYKNDAVRLPNGEWRFKYVRFRMEIMSPYSQGWVKKPFHDFGVGQDETAPSA
jgi:hypothetical protein